MQARDDEFNTSAVIELVVRLALVAVMVVLCFQVFSPFQNLLAWALILAITLYPLHQGIAARMGGRQGRAATIIVLAGVLLLGVPMVMLGTSFVAHVYDLKATFDSGDFSIAEPRPEVADWPVIGKQVFAAWTEAATNLEEFMVDYGESLRGFITRLVSGAANTAGDVLMFMVSLVVGGIMMAYGESGSRAMAKIFNRLAGAERGGQLFTLSKMTVRSVAAGVVGVAVIQAIILGLGFLLAGIPAAGLLAVVVLVIGILQLPALVISLPAVAYIWVVGDGSTIANVALTVYILVGGAADGFLKPMLLGRGVDVPMPVVLIGALGGMVASGIIGLFVGAVVLSVGYKVFMSWVDEAVPPEVQAALEDGDADADTAAVD